MLNKQLTKIIQNLEKKKFREKYNLFKIEGEKLVGELLRSSLNTHTVIGFSDWVKANKKHLKNVDVITIDEQDMNLISNFQSLPCVIALANIPEYTYIAAEMREKLSLALNGIQDPGNLGTILRIADWFGVRDVFCDSDCASAYNPKCVQASMGAIFRVKTHYTDLVKTIQEMKAEELPIYGTFLNGSNIYQHSLSDKGLIVMGNEGKGISEEIESLTNGKLTIPSFAENGDSSESLNVAAATGIILSEFKRRIR